MSDQPDGVDVDQLLEEFQKGVDRAKNLPEELKEAAVPESDAGERLIEEVSQNLEEIRKASRLPDKDADDFKAAIKREQKAI